MITNRRYLQDQIDGLRREIDQLDKFNQEVYTRKHEELVKRIADLEKLQGEAEAIRKKAATKRRYFYAKVTVVVAVITVLILFLDQVVIDHLLKLK